MPSGVKEVSVASERYVNMRILLTKLPSADAYTSRATDALDGGSSETNNAEL
jgi:hypothetical protein